MHGSVENGKALKNLKNLSVNKKEVWTCGHKDPCLSITGWLLVRFSSVCVRVCVWRAQWLQSCPTLCDPMDSSLPGPSVHGIL